MNWPRITIVTPTYERVEYLEDCILSVLNQRYPNLEYIICDGGSKNPALLHLIRKYEDSLAWWDTKSDRGHAEAIRRGFDKSTGTIMAWLCSDDMLLPGALRAVAARFLQGEEIEFVYGNIRWINARGEKIADFMGFPSSRIALFGILNAHQPGAFWRRSLYERAGKNVGGENWENVIFEPNIELLYRFDRAHAKCTHEKTFVTACRLHEGAVSIAAWSKTREIGHATVVKYYPRQASSWWRSLCICGWRIRQATYLAYANEWRYLIESMRRRMAGAKGVKM